MTSTPHVIVVPTVGRPTLAPLVEALAGSDVIVVDDRPTSSEVALPVGPGVRVLHSGGRGPAAARNVGWRAAPDAEWVVFLDDDVVVGPRWRAELDADLAAARPTTAGVQGRIRVPLPAGRRPTDWERNVAGLERARWATADMAYRRSVLLAVGGFEERFPAAYREDADLALRILEQGWSLAVGRRHVVHPVRPASRWVSVRLQRGNGDDALMRRLHGFGWRERAGVPTGRFGRHLAVTALAATAAGAAMLGRRRMAVAAATGWLAGTAELAWARIAPGPRTADEVLTMAVTSAVLPFAAVGHRARGELRGRRGIKPPAAVLFDRDGTLVHDVPYNGDPARVEPVAGVATALSRLRRAGVRVGVVSNQSGVARGLLTTAQVAAVNRRVDEVLGPFDAWAVCCHGPEDGCGCRKPAPGLIHDAAAALGVDPADCAVIGDIGSDMEAAAAAGARGVLVPTPVTRDEEITSAREVASSVTVAVDVVLGCRGRRP